jgi:hypothetical protein
MRKISLALSLTSFAALAAMSHGQGVMYGVSNNGTAASSLYTINTATGAATVVGSLGFSASFSGLEYMNGSLYVTDLFANGGFNFGSINPATGAATVIAAQGSLNMWGLAANPSLNLFYTVDLDAGNVLKSITPAGVITTIGATGVGFFGTGMAFRASTNTLFATGFDGSLYTINTTTGAATIVGSTGLSFTNAWQGLAFDGSGTLFLNAADNDNLYTINTTTGAATLVGANGPTNGNGIDGLAFAPVPEPASMAALGLGALALLRKRRKA